MLLVVLVLLLALALGGAGFAVHALWYIAAIVLVLWLLGFLISVRLPAAVLVDAGTAGRRTTEVGAH